MTRRELLELLLVERFTPVPKRSWRPIPASVSWARVVELRRATSRAATRDCDEREAAS